MNPRTHEEIPKGQAQPEEAIGKKTSGMWIRVELGLREWVRVPPPQARPKCGPLSKCVAEVPSPQLWNMFVLDVHRRSSFPTPVLEYYPRVSPPSTDVSSPYFKARENRGYILPNRLDFAFLQCPACVEVINCLSQGIYVWSKVHMSEIPPPRKRRRLNHRRRHAAKRREVALQGSTTPLSYPSDFLFESTGRSPRGLNWYEDGSL